MKQFFFLWYCGSDDRGRIVTGATAGPWTGGPVRRGTAYLAAVMSAVERLSTVIPTLPPPSTACCGAADKIICSPERYAPPRWRSGG